MTGGGEGTAMPETNRQVVLKRRPTGMPVAGDFSLVDGPLPEPADGQVLLRGIYLSLDPYMRGRISGQRSYAKPTEIGEVIEGRVVGQVVRSRHPALREGDYAFGGYGWQTHKAVAGGGPRTPRSARATMPLAVMAGRPIAPSRAAASPSSTPPRRRSRRRSAFSA